MRELSRVKMINIGGGRLVTDETIDEVEISAVFEIPDLAAIHYLEEKLIACLSTQNVGYFHSHEILKDVTHLYLYGENAESLFKAIHPILKNIQVIKNATATLSFYKSQEEIYTIEIDI